MSKLDELIQKVNKDFKAEIAQKGVKRKIVPKIPFSSTRANYMTYGGIPMIGAVEFFGEPNGGKTTSALDIVSNAQIQFREDFEERLAELMEELEQAKKENIKKKIQAKVDEHKDTGHRKVLYVDTEMTLDTDWAYKLGVDLDDLILIVPENQTAEQILQMILEFIETGEIGLAILDSIPCLVPQQIFEESLEKKSYGGISGPLTNFSARVSPLLKKHECVFIGINQEREDLGSMYSNYTTPGGKGWKHACSLRIRFRKGALLDKNNKELTSKAENPAGNIVEMQIIKTKVCKPDRRMGRYTLSYTYGIDVQYDLITTMIDFGLITGKGWYTFVDDEGNELLDKDDKIRKYNGRNAICNMWDDEPEFYAECYEKVLERLKEVEDNGKDK